MFMDVAAERARRFKDLLVNRLGSDVECVVLTGSHARGDARPDSDIDLWVFLKEVNNDILQAVGRAVNDIGQGYEVNPQCLTFAEAETDGFSKGFSIVQLHLDGVVLHGELKIPMPQQAEIREECMKLAAFCLMSARHYITVCEPEKALLRKLDRFLLKPLVWAIRYEVFLRTGEYHKATDDLCQAITDPETRELVSIRQELCQNRYQGQCTPVIYAAASACSRILSTV